MVSKVEISHKTIIFIALFVAAIWLVLQIHDILFLLFIAFILMSALKPIVDFIVQFRVPRALAILLIYIVVFGVFGVSIAGTLPSLVGQFSKFIQDLPVFALRVLPDWNLDAGAFSQQIAPIGENVVKLTVSVFSNIVTTLTVLVLTFYFLLGRRQLEAVLGNTVGEETAGEVLAAVHEIEQRLGAWVLGQLLLMIIIGVLVYAGLTLLHVEFALPLALIAGLLEIVPVIGPIVSAIPAILVALSVSPVFAIFVAVLYFIVQQFENNFIVPLIMKRSVGLSPLITIFSLMVGGKLAGVTGAILSIPVVLVIQVVLARFFAHSAKSER